jgi:hypothetical protein
MTVNDEYGNEMPLLHFLLYISGFDILSETGFEPSVFTYESSGISDVDLMHQLL